VNPVQELSGGSPTANLLTGLLIDEFFTRSDSTTTRDYLTDIVGNSVALTDGSGAVQTAYTYEPFGSTSITGSSTSNAITFTGREADGTSLLFYRARYYDSRLQRFLNEDPAGVSGGINLFAYVSNTPTGYRDPFGLKPCQWVSWFRPCDSGQTGGSGGPNGTGSGAGGPGGPGSKPSGPPSQPNPNSDRPPDSDQPNCPSYGSKVADDIRLTNSLPGTMMPPGLGLALGTGRTFGNTLGFPTLGGVARAWWNGTMVEAGGVGWTTTEGLILGGFNAAIAGAAAGVVYEAGVVAGSAIRAAFEGCR